MIKLDDNLLQQLGLGDLPEAERKQLLAHIYETLQLRVGTTLAQQMSDAQLDEFESIIQPADGGEMPQGDLDDATQAKAAQWLEQNFPSYKDVVQNELETLKGEIKQSAPAIVEESE